MRLLHSALFSLPLAAMAAEILAGPAAWEWHRARAYEAYNNGDQALVEEQLDLALAVARSVPDATPEVATSLNDQGSWRHHLGDMAGAERLLGEALAMREQLYPGGHVELAHSLNSLSSLYLELGRFEAAGKLITRARRIAMMKGGPHHVQTQVANMYAGRLAIERNDLLQAEFLLLSAVPDPDRPRSDDHDFYGANVASIGVYYLAVVYHLQGRPNDAAKLHRRAIGFLRDAYGPGHRMEAAHLCEWARLDIESGEIGRAVAKMGDALNIIGNRIARDRLAASDCGDARADLLRVTGAVVAPGNQGTRSPDADDRAEEKGRARRDRTR